MAKFNNEKGLGLDRKNNLYVCSKHQANGFIIGNVLGDGCMYRYFVKGKVGDSNRDRTRVNLSICHCEKQLDYLLWKESVIRAYIKFCNLIKDGSKKEFVYYKKQSLVESTKNLVYLYEKFYVDRVKIVNKKLLNRLTNLGMAVWFMDDGSLIPHSYKEDGSVRALKLRLHTSCFTYEEHLVMKKYFGAKNIHFNIMKDREYYCLSTGCIESIKNFVEPIKPFIELVDCMKYKIEPYNNFISANQPKQKVEDIVSST